MSSYTNFSNLISSSNGNKALTLDNDLKFNISVDDEVKLWIDLDLTIPRGVRERLDQLREQQRIQKEAEDAKKSVEPASSDWMPDEVCKVSFFCFFF